MRIDGYTPVEVLRHGNSIAYIDLDDGELMHWKYIKRVKLPNGKWRYYYDVGQKARAMMYRSKQELVTAEEAEKDARMKRDHDLDRLKKSKSTKETNDAFEDLDTSHYWVKKRTRETNFRKEAYHLAVLEYEKTPLYKLEKSKKSIEKGMKAISKAFSNLFKKKKK